ncbi:MAG: carboxypeptidase regulatory-like domain-containing protein [Acidobacteriota bacterium]
MRLLAQVAGASASINGTVADPSGGVIPGAQVVVHDVERNLDKSTLTNERGYYVLLDLTPGKYTMRVTKEGFSSVAQTQFTLVVNQTATFDFTLPLGAVEQSVTVDASASEMLQASTAELGTVITSKPVADLPLNGRNFTQLLTLTPGASSVNVSQNSGGGFADPVGSFSFPAVNGQTNRSNLFLLDGFVNEGSFSNTYAVAPIIDAIQEFKVQSHNDVAEFGGVLGGIVNVVTKAGTNQFHGSAWEFLRNDALDARNPFADSVTPLKQNQFGGAVGGPVLLPGYSGRDRTFFYGAYQGFRRHSASESLLTVPTAAQLAGDFSDLPTTIYNPFSTRPDPNNPGQFIRDPFPNNNISQFIKPGLALYAKQIYPTAIDTGVAGFNARDTTPNIIRNDEETIRIDHQMGNKDFLWFRYSRVDQPSSGSGGLPSVRGTSDLTAYNWGVNYTHTFGTTSVASFQFGRTVSFIEDRNQYLGAPENLWEQAGFSSEFAGNYLPEGNAYNVGIGLDGYSGIPVGSQAFSLNAHIKQYKGQFATIFGRHSLKMGAEFSTNSYPKSGLDDRAWEDFSPFQTANLQSPGGTGDAFASFLLGVPDSAQRLNVRQLLRGGWVNGFFFQDQWKATSKLTVNLGFRYDVTLRPLSLGNNNFFHGNFDMNTGTYILGDLPPACEQVGTAPCIPGGTLPEHVVVTTKRNHAILDNDFSNIQPRIGLAYRLGSKTALRASYSMFFDNWAAVLQYSGNWTPSWPSLGVFGAFSLNSDVPTVTAENPAPSLGRLPDPTPFESFQCWCVDPKIKMPYSDQWNFGIQHQLSADTLVTANYAGSHSSRLDLGRFVNIAPTPGPGDPRERSPFPYMSPQFFDQSTGRSNYHAFQFTLDKRFSNGLSYLAAYTWSKSIDIACSGWFGDEGCANQNPYDVNADRSVSGFDVPHMVSLSWLYELPFGQGKKFKSGNPVVDHVVAGWQVNGIGRFTSGAPFTVVVSGDIANTGNAGNYMRPNLAGNPVPSNRGPNNWLNRSAFEVPAPFTFGNLGRNTFRSDGYKGLDLSLFRKFSVTESKHLEFRAEFFNAFNTPVWGIPTRNLSSGNFGRVSRTVSIPRQVQFGLKFVF